MTQSRILSLAESAANVVIGYVLAVITQIILFPLFGWNPTLAQNITMGAMFTINSVLRSYALRRVFESTRPRGDQCSG